MESKGSASKASYYMRRISEQSPREGLVCPGYDTKSRPDFRSQIKDLLPTWPRKSQMGIVRL